MITYKLAKQLKEGGFPQRKPNEVFAHNLKKRKNGWVEGKMKDLEKIYIPTLSELIEACGEDLMGLHRVNRRNKEWIAENYFSLRKSKKNLAEIGKSPDVAVAKLWLKLKQTSD